MLRHAGVVIFLFGNKRDSTAIVPADGMREEFRIAVNRHLFVAPVGCTGSTAATLHKEVLDDFDKYYPQTGYRRLFEALGQPGTPSQVTERVVKLITKLREDKALPDGR